MPETTADIVKPPYRHPRLSRNNFDLLRLLFATTVCLVHAYELSGFQSLQPLTMLLSSAVAVKAFFVVSGFLIFMSFERSTSLLSYAEKRFRRIYPAYAAVILICAFCLATVADTGFPEYFSAAWLKYVLANLTFLNFLQPSIPGVFSGNSLAAVNGALWTLKIEVMFYLSVPIFVYLLRKFGRLSVLSVTYGLSVAYAMLMARAAASSNSELFSILARQLPGQLSYFMAGAFFFYYLDFFERHVTRFAIAAAVILAADRILPLPFIEPFALATAVVFFSLFLYAGRFGKYGDFSYGVYIVHFPIIQVLLEKGWFTNSPWLFLGTAVVGTAIAAIMLWHLVEKRFLLRTSHYVATMKAKAQSALQTGTGFTGTPTG